MFRVLNNNKGAIMVLGVGATLLLVGASALAVDIGYRALTKNQLQSAADQAALAGASATTNRMAVAQTYAKKSPGQTSDKAPNVNVEYDGAKTFVTVTTSRSISPLFATGGPVVMSATAKAVSAPANYLPSGVAAPFVIQEPKNLDWSEGNGMYTDTHYMKIKPSGSNDFGYANITFKYNSGNMDENNKNYWNYLQGKGAPSLTIDSSYYYWSDATGSENGVKQFATRLKTGKPEDITSCAIGDTRLMMVPVVSTLPSADDSYQNGTKITKYNSQCKIIGFIGFWFDDIEYGDMKTVNGINYYPDFKIKGRFVRINLPTSATASTPTVYFGPYNIYLVE